MEDALEKKRLEKLARVRDNQRKSRARKQDHIRELEQKVLSLQQELDRKDVQHRLAVQSLTAENQKLRHLHLASGVPHDALEAYLRSVDNPVMAQKIAIQRMPTETCSRKQDTTCSRPCSGELNSCSKEVTPAQHPVSVAFTSKENTDVKNESQDGSSDKCPEADLPSFCACAPEEGPQALPISERVLNTTFCAIAEKLVDQYNTRGVDVSDIKRKLRQGFFRSSTEEGCRVQNQVLFQVLDEISNH
ncbi:bZIP transcription factor [Aspergillus stella-maris]|uniref:bZIP transcription factor n=1 Tax=Aspergillus stella-maris TaxID=1810926 RepID=UPI003CCD179A